MWTHFHCQRDLGPPQLQAWHAHSWSSSPSAASFWCAVESQIWQCLWLQVSILEPWYLLSLCVLVLIIWRGMLCRSVRDLTAPFTFKASCSLRYRQCHHLKSCAVSSPLTGSSSLNIQGLILLILKIIDISIRLYLLLFLLNGIKFTSQWLRIHKSPNISSSENTVIAHYFQSALACLELMDGPSGQGCRAPCRVAHFGLTSSRRQSLEKQGEL